MSDGPYRTAETRRVVAYAEALGFVARLNAVGHWTFRHPNGSTVVTGSKQRRRDYARQKLRKAAQETNA